MAAVSYGHVKLMVRDLAAQTAFYVNVMGMVELQRIEDMSGPVRFAEVFLATAGVATPQFALMHYPDSPTPAPGSAVIVLVVDNVDTQLDAIVAAGGAITTPAMDVPEFGIRLAFAADPEGHPMEIMHPLA